MLPSDVDQYRVIDTDTHVIEPYDLWTSRLSVAKWGDKVPHVRVGRAPQEDALVLRRPSASAPRHRRRRPAGTSSRRTTRRRSRRGRSRHVGCRRPPGPHGRVRDLGAGAVPERGRLRRRQGARHRRSRADAGVRPGVQRLPDRLRLGRPQALHPDHGAAVLGHGPDRGRRSTGAPPTATRASS